MQSHCGCGADRCRRVTAQSQAFVLDNICYSPLPPDQWPSFAVAPPAVPSTCSDELLTFDDIRNLGELCASMPPARSC